MYADKKDFMFAVLCCHVVFWRGSEEEGQAVYRQN
jgi:hypothetical protein